MSRFRGISIGLLALTLSVPLYPAEEAQALPKRNRIGKTSAIMADADAVYNICLQHCADSSVYRVALESCKSTCAELRRDFPLRDRGYSSLESCAKAMDTFDLNRDELARCAAGDCDDLDHMHKRQGCREGTAAFYGAITTENICARGSYVTDINRQQEAAPEVLVYGPVVQAPVAVYSPLAPPAAQPGTGQIFPPMEPKSAVVVPPASRNEALVVVSPAQPQGSEGALPAVSLPPVGVSTYTTVVQPAGRPAETVVGGPSYWDGTLVLGPTMYDTPKYQYNTESRPTAVRPTEAPQKASKPNHTPAQPKTGPILEKDAPMPEISNIPVQQTPVANIPAQPYVVTGGIVDKTPPVGRPYEVRETVVAETPLAAGAPVGGPVAVDSGQVTVPTAIEPSAEMPVVVLPPLPAVAIPTGPVVEIPASPLIQEPVVIVPAPPAGQAASEALSSPAVPIVAVPTVTAPALPGVPVAMPPKNMTVPTVQRPEPPAASSVDAPAQPAAPDLDSPSLLGVPRVPVSDASGNLPLSTDPEASL